MILAVNFKTYKESTGKNALKLAKVLAKLKSKNMILAVQTSDIQQTAGKIKIPVYSQHVDFHEQGRNTGYSTIESLKQAGANGSLLNHSEHKISRIDIAETIFRCKKNKFRIILCTETLQETKEVLKYNPDMLALEIPELISTGKSISKMMPKQVEEFSSLVRAYNKKHKTKIKALCGAGISNAEDVKLARKLGCDGVLVASAIVKSKNPGKLAKEMANA